MTEQPPAEDSFHVGIAITRVFDASIERVWREWTDPKAFADWFGGREGVVPLSTVSMDVRPGGAWSLTMFAGQERREIHWHGEYREVVEPERLVLTFADQPGDDRYELIVVVLKSLDDGRTEMTFEQRGLMTPEAYKGARVGLVDVLRSRRSAPHWLTAGSPSRTRRVSESNHDAHVGRPLLRPVAVASITVSFLAPSSPPRPLYPKFSENIEGVIPGIEQQVIHVHAVVTP